MTATNSDVPGQWHPSGRTLAADLQLLAAGEETGWWDEHGRPAPWPQDFLDPTAEWSNGLIGEPAIDRAADDPDHPPF